jgi:exopolysaccharide biosynthesis polyprenyl glycosylphosphotransferase
VDRDRRDADHRIEDQTEDQTERLPGCRGGPPQQGGIRVAVPESDLPRPGGDDHRLSAFHDGDLEILLDPDDTPAYAATARNGHHLLGVSGNGLNGVPANGGASATTAPHGLYLRPAAPTRATVDLRDAGPEPGYSPRWTGSPSASAVGAATRPGPVAAGPVTAGIRGAGAPQSTTVPVRARVAGDYAGHRLGARRANRPVRSASSAAAVVTRPAWMFGGWLLRDGVRPLLLGADLTACAIATAIVHRPHWTTGLFVALLVGLYGFGGLYRSRLSLSLLDDVPRVVGRWLAAVALTVLTQSARSRASWGQDDVNWSMVITAMTAVLLILVLRAIAYNFVRRVRSQRRVAHRTLILGAGHVGEQVARTLLKRSEYGLQPIGFVDNHPLIDPETCSVPLLGGTETLSDVLVREDVRNVVVAFGSVRESQMVDIIRTCDRLRCEIFLVPRLFELHQVSDDMDTVWGLPLVRLRRATYRSHGWHVKRVFDVIFASASLLVLWPLMTAAAIAVRLEGGPGILFRQERVGADGRRFDVLKFRSLRPVDDAESATNWNIQHDDRLGPVGRFLRKSSIDELPQLFNILRGEMSLVGPRPERPHFVAQFRQTYPRYVARHRVPSGLTGWAQVHGLRGDTSIADRAMFDNYYIENWSLWLDVKILLRTVGSVVRGQGG